MHPEVTSSGHESPEGLEPAHSVHYQFHEVCTLKKIPNENLLRKKRLHSVALGQRNRKAQLLCSRPALHTTPVQTIADPEGPSVLSIDVEDVTRPGFCLVSE